MPRTRALVIAAALSLAAADTAGAMKIEGVEFASQVQVAGATLSLHNAALLRYRIFLKAYVGALYLAPEVAANRVLEDVPKRLEIEYFWSISAPDFAGATSEGIAKNVDPATLAQLQPRIDRINRLYLNVAPGDRYALSYVPGVGTELALNGRALGSIEGADFAAALFAIWLGPSPIDDSFRDDLLTRR
jgi:Chalcone isomerase-like